MNKILSLLLILGSMSTLTAQNCMPADITLESQADVDNFVANHGTCTTITGNLRIQGNDIVNLAGLQNITSVGGVLRISGNNTLTNVDGLQNLTSVGGAFRSLLTLS